MASLDELIASIAANKQAADEFTAQIEASKQQAEEVLSAVIGIGAEGVANAVQAVKDQLEQASAQNNATANQLEEARSAAEAAKNS